MFQRLICVKQSTFLDIYDTMALFIVKSVLDIYALTSSFDMGLTSAEGQKLENY